MNRISKRKVDLFSLFDVRACPREEEEERDRGAGGVKNETKKKKNKQRNRVSFFPLRSLSFAHAYVVSPGPLSAPSFRSRPPCPLSYYYAPGRAASEAAAGLRKAGQGKQQQQQPMLLFFGDGLGFFDGAASAAAGRRPNPCSSPFRPRRPRRPGLGVVAQHRCAQVPCRADG